MPGSFGWSNLAALLLVLSNFLDHTDGRNWRAISGKTKAASAISMILASDAVVTILLFIAIGGRLDREAWLGPGLFPPALLRPWRPATAIALIFLFAHANRGIARARPQHGQASLGGFETGRCAVSFPRW